MEFTANIFNFTFLHACQRQTLDSSCHAKAEKAKTVSKLLGIMSEILKNMLNLYIYHN